MKKKAHILRDEIKSPDQAMESRKLMKSAGRVLCPIGYEHQACVSIHFFKKEKDISGLSLFAFICHQTGMGEIHEVQADAAFKEAQRAIMSVYGRSPAKTRDGDALDVPSSESGSTVIG
jgi:hypothetical protein